MKKGTGAVAAALQDLEMSKAWATDIRPLTRNQAGAPTLSPRCGMRFRLTGWLAEAVVDLRLGADAANARLRACCGVPVVHGVAQLRDVLRALRPALPPTPATASLPRPATPPPRIIKKAAPRIIKKAAPCRGGSERRVSSAAARDLLLALRRLRGDDVAHREPPRSDADGLLLLLSAAEALQCAQVACAAT